MAAQGSRRLAEQRRIWEKRLRRVESLRAIALNRIDSLAKKHDRRKTRFR